MKTSRIKNWRGIGSVIAALLVFFITGSGLWAQGLGGGNATAAPAPLPKVGSVKIVFTGASVISEDVVRGNMQTKEGTLLDDTILDRDIRTLYQTGLFEYIEVKRTEGAGGVVDLFLGMTPKFRVLVVKYQGNKEKSASTLEDEVKTKAGMVLDERQVKEDVEKLRVYYQESGFSQVQIGYSIDRNRETNFGTVIFKIREGVKSRITDIVFAGNEHVKEGKLRGQMDTTTYWWWISWLTGKGRLKDKEFEDDLDKVRDYYREQGYLDVEIPSDKVAYEYPKEGKLVIRIFVKEGRQYKIGEMKVTGATLIPEDYLLRITRLKTGDVYVPTKIDKGVEAMEDAYGVGGYLDSRVQLMRSPNVTTGNIDLEFKIRESEKYYVETVRIDGNTKTKSVVILRELSLGPGDVFDMVRMKNSKIRLQNTRFFEDVNMTPESTNIPNRKNLKVGLKEGKTGDLSLGLGFSSLERLMVFAEISQSNFDLFNPGSLFQGAGQKFRIRMQLGTVSSDVTISFEEPWMFNRQLAFGFTLFMNEADYYSSYYNESHLGAEFYVRKRLIEYIEVRPSYTIDLVNIRDVSSHAPQIIQDEKGRSLISRVGVQFLRDTRDMLINTNRGSRIALNLDLAGGPFGGDYDYYKIELRDAHFFPITERQVFSVLARAGVMEGYNDSTVPFYERFYLGGMYTLRGFEYRDVGPKDDATNEPIGGKSYGMLSFEYTIAIVDQLRFAVFYDAGFVNEDSYDFHYKNYSANVGFGIRLMLMGAPLSLDYGIPVRTQKDNDKGNQFNFSFGTRF